MKILSIKGQRVFGRFVGWLLKKHGLDPVYSEKDRYIFLNIEEKAIKLPFYMKILIKYFEKERG